MEIARVRASELEELGPVAVAARVRALVPDAESVHDRVREIVDAVRAGGDDALARYTRELDTAGEEPPPLLVAPAELDAALTQLAPETVAGLQVAIANVARVAEASVAADVRVELAQGQRVALREVPVGSAAVYVPAGRAPYPSTVVMGVVTARAAGVIDVAVCAPPRPSGIVDPAILGTCRLCGVERVYRMGGAQAIAALAYGTETVAAVDVIVGPGNLYVQEAKHQVSVAVGIDGFAGPSDLLAVLDATVGDGALRLVALDMLAQAEHGAGSLVVAAAPPAVCDALAPILEELALSRPTVGDAAFALVEADGPRGAIGFANAFAPEHLQLVGDGVEALSATVTSAGCVFVGAASATAFGDYVAGSNHILPTAGAARFSSGLSVRTFRRRMTEVRVGEGAEQLAAAGAPIARAEGFAVHAESMEARVGQNPGS